MVLTIMQLLVLSRLRSARLSANAEKCVFGKSRIEFLGHTVTADGITPIAAPDQGHRRPPLPNKHQGAAELPGGDKLLQEVRAEGRRHLAAADGRPEGQPKRKGGGGVDRRETGRPGISQDRS